MAGTTATEFEHLSVQRDGAIAHITLDRPTATTRSASR